MIKVVPYYVLKQRRQQFGFEGDNLKTAKFKDILSRSVSITLSAIQVSYIRLANSLEPNGYLQAIDETHYVVRSSSTSDSYDVDLATLTCSCADYPQIAFCKHLAAVKRELPMRGNLEPDPALSGKSPQSPNPPSEAPPGPESFALDDFAESTPLVTQTSKPHLALQLAQKLEHLAACLRHNDSTLLVLDDLSSLTERIDEVLERFFRSRSSLLPPRVPNIPPNVKGWSETKAVMMPPKKTRSKRAGDPAYGAGEKSGKKAKVKGGPSK